MTTNTHHSGACAFVVKTDRFSPRYRKSEIVALDDTPPILGDDVLCHTETGEIAIGEVLKIDGGTLTLADSCHAEPGPNFTLTPVRYWRVRGRYSSLPPTGAFATEVLA